MADNKQYITQVQENGNVMISEDVITTIVSQAISEVEGVVSLSAKPGMDIAEIIGMKNWGKGIKITFGQSDEVYIDCNVVVSYGQNVVNVAKSVQETVTGAVEPIAGVTVAAVNVNICGISRQ
ncbi:MAG TPA: Asp23/Gls24 family envelope stress response protein [Candidatus Faecousia intestinigallinarum]|nr:Asp23/Gls24 family envelope stress response protein [Candidatus Faecousia intestinigallinarum]